MPQFDIVENTSKSADVKYFLVLQADAISLLDTRIVAPLRPADLHRKNQVGKIHILVEIDQTEFIIFISEMAAIPSAILGEIVTNVSFLRTEIVSAIDLIFTGF